MFLKTYSNEDRCNAAYTDLELTLPILDLADPARSQPEQLRKLLDSDGEYREVLRGRAAQEPQVYCRDIAKCKFLETDDPVK
ncbi:MAG: hypothetical protein ACLU9T_04175 [Blautia faecis]